MGTWGSLHWSLSLNTFEIFHYERVFFFFIEVMQKFFFLLSLSSSISSGTYQLCALFHSIKIDRNINYKNNN